MAQNDKPLQSPHGVYYENVSIDVEPGAPLLQFLFRGKRLSINFAAAQD